jgi:lysophospholipase L1-like esterase
VSRSVRSKSRFIFPSIILGITLCCALFGGQPASAVDADKVWSWTDAKPYRFSSTPVTDTSGALYCPVSYQTRVVIGEFLPKEVCLFDSDSFRFGQYYDNGQFHYVVGFGSDPRVYGVHGTPCYKHDTCTYLPDTDVMIAYQYIVSGRVPSMVVYKNFSSRVMPSLAISASTPGYFGYEFNGSRPDYTFTTESGYAWPVAAIGASQNGKWVAFEVMEHGFAVLNVETLEVKRISNIATTYGRGFDPAGEMAISNDGHHVAFMGQNAGFLVWDVDENCGDIPTNYNIGSTPPLERACKLADIVQPEILEHFRMATHPRFNDEGAELSFYATSYVSQEREIIMRAHGYSSPRLDYLAMGDSFSSGEGDMSDAYYLPGTNTEFEKCHVSTRSYPFWIAAYFGIEQQYVKNVACSGATMGDVIGEDELYTGQGGRLGKGHRDLNNSQKLLSQTEAKEKFIPGRIHQKGFAERYHPKVITIGVSGNDVGFMLKLRTCVTSIDTCEWATDQGRVKMAAEIKGFFETMVNTYNQIHESSPASLIYVMGYPQVIDATGICAPDVLLLNTTEREFMRQSITYLNQVIKRASQKSGVSYIDIESSIGTSVLCGGELVPAVNGFRFGDDSKLLKDWPGLNVIGSEGFHPNQTGQQLMSLAAFIDKPLLTTATWCASGAAVCPANVTAPDPSSYWGSMDALSMAGTQRHVAMTDDNADMYPVRSRRIVAPNYSFAPGTPIRAEVHSDPYVLGTFTASASGSLDETVMLPDTLPQGYHTIHLYGTAYGGQAVDLYDIIAYGTPQTSIGTADTNGTVQTGTQRVATSTAIATIDQSDTYDNVPYGAQNSAVVAAATSRQSNATGDQQTLDISIDQPLQVSGLSLLMIGIVYGVYMRMRRNR